MDEAKSPFSSVALMAAATDTLAECGYDVSGSDPFEEVDVDSRIFEDEYSVVLVSVLASWDELQQHWRRLQARFIELLSEHIPRTAAKAWEGYLVLLTPGLAGREARPQIESIRYDTERLRKIVATGEELETSADVGRVLAPLVPINVEPFLEACDSSEELERVLVESGVTEPLARELVEAFDAQDSLLECLYRRTGGKE